LAWISIIRYSKITENNFDISIISIFRISISNPGIKLYKYCTGVQHMYSFMPSPCSMLYAVCTLTYVGSYTYLYTVQHNCTRKFIILRSAVLFTAEREVIEIFKKNLGGPGPPQAPVTLRLWPELCNFLKSTQHFSKFSLDIKISRDF